jgi:UDP-N-acetylglucosamine 1-carboxyvinyltransferase
MDQIKIQGGKRLTGSVQVSGAKNAALPILFSSLLTDRPSEYARVPALHDIVSTLQILEHFGVRTDWNKSKGSVKIFAESINTFEAPYDLVRKMRASTLVLGPLLARFGEAKVSLPGGCAIGARPINYHLKGLEALGAEILLESGYVMAKAKRLIGNKVVFEFPSVGATENILMAAVLAKGESVLENCAREPEIVDLARSLRSMGAEIEGEGTETIRVQGKDSISGAKHSILGDRIEAGTYLIAGFITGGQVQVCGVLPDCLDAVLDKLEQCGAKISRGTDSIDLAFTAGVRPKAVDINTLPFPGFPTDMQAQFMALMCRAEGSSVITETVFENRFMHVPELMRLGADITIRGESAYVRGVEKLTGAPLMATDLRASASLILGGLAAQGETIVNRIYHLDRGYEKIEEKLRSLGADIERIK